MRRLTLVAGQPVMPEDVTEANILYHSALGVAGPALSLSGYAANSLHDVFRRNGVLCTAPLPPVDGTYNLVSGTPIGGMSHNGGLACAYDGNPIKGYLTSAKSPGAVTGISHASCIGLRTATPQAIKRFVATSPTDNSFLGNNNPTPWQWRTSNVDDFASAEITAQGTTPTWVPGGIKLDVTIPNPPSTTHRWLAFAGNVVNATYLAQLEPYTFTSSSPRGIVDNEFGEPVNQFAMQCQSDNGLIELDPFEAEYLGMFMIDPVAGKASHKVGYGLDRYSGVWNARNQVQLLLRAGDPRDFVNGDKVYTPVAYGATQPPYQFGPVENNPLIRLRVLSGLHQHATSVTYSQSYFMSNVSAYWFGIGIDSLNTPSGRSVFANHDNAGDYEGDGQIAECAIAPFVGMRMANALEGQRYGAQAFWGEQDMLLSAAIWH